MLANLPEMVLRVSFKSGRVAEERGNESVVMLLFESDQFELIDHVMALEMESNECHIYCRQEDDRFEGIDVLFPSAITRKR